MPEGCVLILFEREVGWEEHRQPVSVDRTNDNLFMGDFVVHSACCADVEGRRQTFTVHASSPADPNFMELPPIPPISRIKTVSKTKKKKAKKSQTTEPPSEKQEPAKLESVYCKSCYAHSPEPGAKSASLDPPSESHNHSTTSPIVLEDPNMPAADFINSLNIHGRISAKARGKELVVAICNSITGGNFVFRVSFGLEGHCFWIPTEWYQKIVNTPTVQRGSKSQAYPVPDEYIDGPANGVVISIQAAFIRPEHTLIFCDHNVMIQFHFMQMPPKFSAQDLDPASSFWPHLWSRNHGPVYSQEPEATLRTLDDWRARILLDRGNLGSIYIIMKTDQSVFNGSGAQEATDQLILALIHPQMPALYVCSHDAVWTRFRQAFIDYDVRRMSLTLPDAKLPYVSGASPFRMNISGHTKYLHHILGYRRSRVVLSATLLGEAHTLGLFVPNAVIQPDGSAQVITTLRADRGQETVRVPNFAITIDGNESGRTSYTPFTARGDTDWLPAKREAVLSDVKADVNSPTLGLYSFRILVDCVWSAQKLTNITLPSGPRPLVTVGQSGRKRPRAEEIKKTAASKKRRISAEVENFDPANFAEGISTHSTNYSSGVGLGHLGDVEARFLVPG
ncbi:hypothetical protein B0H16DRAFT_1800606 [Mycena metata]|uniref:Uncharacterized protein n=1 Tax=Mycena metata TaxID=1033252 RepID=A0AAD7MGX3_9AGAR|nr:hypothetical protein B0H16DRAFT_1800606 [Mycena metata]